MVAEVEWNPNNILCRQSSCFIHRQACIAVNTRPNFGEARYNSFIVSVTHPTYPDYHILKVPEVCKKLVQTSKRQF